MNTFIQAGKNLLNALAFANAENDSECRKLLHQLDERGDSQIASSSAPNSDRHPVVATAMRTAQRAL
jgi:hypothetical protein